MLNYDFTPEELEAMSVKYCDQNGFNYLKLLEDVEPRAPDSGWVRNAQISAVAVAQNGVRLG